MHNHIPKIAVLLLITLLVVGGASLFFAEEEVAIEIIEEEVVVEKEIMQVIGKSVEGRDIEAHTYGEGDTHLLFVGGIHGGYEWNSVILAYEMIDYFKENQNDIPENITMTIIPSLNPDGVFNVTQKEGRFTEDEVIAEDQSVGKGRFNANGIDLNRNFACNWAPESTWKGNVVSAGTEAFSEPEAKALKNFIEDIKPTAVVFWHSQANAVFASSCNDGTLPETITVMNTYANAAGYAAVETFSAYSVTGDAEGWLADIGIPAVTVELETHETVEFERNIKGVKALLESYKLEQ